MNNNQKAVVETDAHTVIFSKNDHHSALFESALEARHCQHQRIIGGIHEAIAYCDGNALPENVVLDVSHNALLPELMLFKTLVQTLSTRSRLIVIGSIDELDTCLSLQQLGVDEYLSVPLSRMSVEKVIHMPSLSLVTPSHQESPKDSKQIAVIGAKAGSGATTLIACLSAMLAKKTKQVAVADLDFIGGDLDLHLDFKANNRLLEMLRFPERLEPVIYQRSSTCALDNLQVFTGYSGQGEQEFWPDLDSFDAVSDFCLNHADYLLWDIPAFSLRDQVGFHAVQRADVCVLVVEPTLSSLRQTNVLLQRLDQNSGQRVFVVLNQTKPAGSSLLTPEDIVKVIGRDVDITIPYAPKAFLSSASIGELPFEKNRKLNSVMKQLSDLIIDEPAAKKAFFARLFGGK